MFKPETSNKLNTMELQIVIGEQGPWNMVKLAKSKLAHNLIARVEHREE
jgi:hypothetical protein